MAGNHKSKASLWVRILCIFLAVLMVGSIIVSLLNLE